TFAPGETSKPVTVNVNGDVLDEPNETFFVNLSNPTASTIADAQGQGTILDDDPATVTLSIADAAAVVEGNNATFTVTLTGATGQTVTVIATTSSGSAVSGSDFTPNTQTLTFLPGQTTMTFTVATLDDSLDEADETFEVTLSAATNALIDDGSAVGTIQDNDAAPTISINDVSVAESAGFANFAISLSAASGQPVTVVASTSPGTASAGADFTATTQTITFAPGETSKTFSVPVLEDTLDEANETFSVTLTPTSVLAVDTGGSDLTGVGTITDNDATPTLSIGDVTAD